MGWDTADLERDAMDQGFRGCILPVAGLVKTQAGHQCELKQNRQCFSFDMLSDGWHHLTAVGAPHSYGQYKTEYFINGSSIGHVDHGQSELNLDGSELPMREVTGLGASHPLCCLGNVNFMHFDVDEDGESTGDGQVCRNQPWGHMADLRVFYRALNHDEIHELSLYYDLEAGCHHNRRFGTTG